MMIKLTSRDVMPIAISREETTGNTKVELNHEHPRSQHFGKLSRDQSLLLLFPEVTPRHYRRQFANNAIRTTTNPHPKQHLFLQGITIRKNGRSDNILDLKVALF